MGTGSVAARIGGIIAPFLISLQDHASWVPNTIFGVFGKYFSKFQSLFRLKFDEIGR